MISNRLPGNAPRKPAKDYQPGMGGDISLSPVVAAWGKMKVWRQKDSGSGEAASALSKEMLEKLLADISKCIMRHRSQSRYQLNALHAGCQVLLQVLVAVVDRDADNQTWPERIHT